MVSRFDAIAWVDHAPAVGIEVVMPKTFRPSKRHNATAQTAEASLEAGDEKSLAKMEHLSGINYPDKATAVLIGFMDAIFKEGAHNWSPEERKKRVDACLAEVKALRGDEDKKDIHHLSRELRQQIEDGKFYTTPSPSKTSRPNLSVDPFRPRQEVQQEIKALAESIDFG